MENNRELQNLGWNERFRELFGAYAGDGYIPARISREDRGAYRALTSEGEITAEVSGRFMHEAEIKSDYPAVGDWVAVAPVAGEKKGIIHAVLERKSTFSRNAAGRAGRGEGGKTEEQIAAANIDTVFLVSGLDGDYNPRRIERYITVGYQSGAEPVVVLNKADACSQDIRDVIEEVEILSIGIPVLAVSAKEQTGIEELRSYLKPGKTVAFLGSSGVGKSSLINCLLGEEKLEVREVREDDSRGRHTTTHRELIVLSEGGIVIDTPGMRELQLWADEGSLSETFQDIEKLALQCKFSDCSHRTEPGCAVIEALENGELDLERLESFRKLGRELEYLANKQAGSVRRAEKEKWQKIMKPHRYKKRY